MSLGSLSSTSTAWETPGEDSGPRVARINPAIIQLVMLVAIPFCLSSEDGIRILIALIVTGLLIGLMSFVPVVGILATFVYLVLMTGFRRWLFPIFGYSGSDPFLIVAPIVAGLNFANVLIGRSVPRDTRVSRLILWLICWMVVQILNPLQGGIIVGLGGALFYIVPLLWFYVGRLYTSDSVYAKIVRVCLVVTVLAALYGQYQTFVGFLPSEVRYMSYTGFAERISDTVSRVYSTLSSPSDYASLLTIAGIFSCAYALRRQRIFVLFLAVMLAAAFLTGIRGAVVNLVFACCCLWAVQGKTMQAWLPRLAAVLAIGFLGVLWSARGVQVRANSSSTGAASELVGHQVTGLLNPTQSTASGHVTMQLYGILGGITHPLGYGLGSTTLAAKYGSAGTSSTEGDFGNAFTAMGVIGGVLFLALFYQTLKAAAVNWHRSRSLESLCALGCLIVCIGQWLNGGTYSVVFLVWCSVGYVDRQTLEYQKIDKKAALEAKNAKQQRRARYLTNS